MNESYSIIIEKTHKLKYLRIKSSLKIKLLKFGNKIVMMWKVYKHTAEGYIRFNNLIYSIFHELLI